MIRLSVNLIDKVFIKLIEEGSALVVFRFLCGAFLTVSYGLNSRKPFVIVVRFFGFRNIYRAVNINDSVFNILNFYFFLN